MPAETEGLTAVDPAQALAAALRHLHRAAGQPSSRKIAAAVGSVSHTSVADALAGRRVPSWAILEKMVRHLQGDPDAFRGLWANAAAPASSDARNAVAVSFGDTAQSDGNRAALVAEARRRAGFVSTSVQRAQTPRTLAAGWPLTETTDPFALEVHRPVSPERPQPDLPALPPYIPREHDAALEQVVQAAAEGHSGIAVLVGGSSTGKTRACWEALGLLRHQPEQWRLWHPIDPDRPDAALRDLASVSPRTIIWLNEAQLYLSTANVTLGERVAAGLRELLRDSGRAPVLVLATLWPESWAGLTASPDNDADRHAQARELLVGHDIPVPAAFTAGQMSQLAVAGDGDVRLALATRSARDGQVVQFLAGAPDLLARYRNAPPAAMALIHAAMDARCLGVGPALPYDLLEAAAPGYLTDSEWDQLGDDWMERALAYTSAPCKGVRGPLTRIRPRPKAEVGSSSEMQQTFMLADYLDHVGRRERRDQIPPDSFWEAARSYIRDSAATVQPGHNADADRRPDRLLAKRYVTDEAAQDLPTNDGNRIAPESGHSLAQNSSPTASDLRGQVQARDEWINFYNDHYHRVVRFVMHNGASVTEAQDAAQEAFTASWELMTSKPNDWQAIAGKAAWVRTFAIRRHARPSGRRRRSLAAGDEGVQDFAAPGPDHAELTNQARVVLQALRSLDSEARVVMAFDLDGFSMAETAAALGVTAQRVRDLKKKARAALKRHLASVAAAEAREP